jgi:hypothetical protein
VLIEVLHVEGRMRSVPRQQKGREGSRRRGSPKGGDWRRHDKLLAMLWWRNADGGGFVSFPKVLGLLQTYTQ